jgi:heme/copper-type cytochrome/quinol oxidase subunit 3
METGTRSSSAGAQAGGSCRMSALTVHADTHWPSDEEVPASGCGPASARVVVTYGFWLFLLSNIVVFGAFFASYSVLHGHTAGGPSGHELFHRAKLPVETACLLFLSYSCALLSLSVDRRRVTCSTLSGSVSAPSCIAKHSHERSD